MQCSEGLVTEWGCGHCGECVLWLCEGVVTAVQYVIAVCNALRVTEWGCGHCGKGVVGVSVWSLRGC